MSQFQANIDVDWPSLPHERALASDAATVSIKYSHDTGLMTTTEKHDGLLQREILQDLRHDLRSQFFDTLFIARPKKQDALRRLLGVNEIVHLIGERGTGKSTLLLELDQHLRTKSGQTKAVSSSLDETSSVHRLDIRDASHHTLAPNAVCGVLFKALDEFFFGGVPTSEIRHSRISPSAVRHEWLYFRVQTCDEFYPLLSELRERMGDEPHSSEALASLLEADPHADHLRKSAQFDWDQTPAFSRLSLLVQFVNRVLHHQLTILIDNVDRYYDLDTQRAIYEKALIIAGPMCRIVFALRTEHVDEISQASRSDMLPDGIKVSEVSVRAPDKLLWDMSARRIGFASDFLARKADEGAEVLEDGKPVDLAECARILAIVSDRLPQLREHLRETRLAHHFLLWHNYSVRHAAHHVASLVSDLIEDGNPVYGLSIDDPDPGFRRLRTAIWRKLVLGVDDLYMGEPALVSLAKGRTSLPSGQVLALPPIRILEHLFVCGETTFGQLLASMQMLGVSERALRRYLGELMAGDSRSHGSFVWIDVKKRTLDRVVSGTRLWLRPAGQFFLEDIATSCEFLFWAGVAHLNHNQSDHLPVNSEGIESDYTRASIACDFVEKRLFEAYNEELTALAETPPQERARRLATLTDLLGEKHTGSAGLFPARALRNINWFVLRSQAQSGLSRAEYQALTERIVILSDTFDNMWLPLTHGA